MQGVFREPAARSPRPFGMPGGEAGRGGFQAGREWVPGVGR